MKLIVAAESVELNDVIVVAGEKFTVVLTGTHISGKTMLCLQDFAGSPEFVWLQMPPYRLIDVRRK